MNCVTLQDEFLRVFFFSPSKNEVKHDSCLTESFGLPSQPSSLPGFEEFSGSSQPGIE